MIVRKLDIERLVAREPKHDLPIRPNRNGPEALALALQWMEAVARKVQRLRALSRVQRGQNILDPTKKVGTNQTVVSPLKKPFQALALEARNHKLKCNQTIVTSQ